MEALYALYKRYGQQPLLEAMARAHQVTIYGADYLKLLLDAPGLTVADSLSLGDAPAQNEIDRLLSSYEAWVTVDVPLGGDEAVASTSSSARLSEVSR